MKTSCGFEAMTLTMVKDSVVGGWWRSRGKVRLVAWVIRKDRGRAGESGRWGMIVVDVDRGRESAE
jgi:hypothetical protein